jgi:ribosomal protein L14
VKKTITVILLALAFIPLASCQEVGVGGVVQSTSIAEGWASNSINAVIFRRNSVVSHEDTQYVAFYDPNATVVLAKRTLGTPDWEIRRTQYTGGVTDAHNSISIMADGETLMPLSPQPVSILEWIPES